jgi:methylmalonyl-CoA mutase cobalamin-binding subunit
MYINIGVHLIFGPGTQIPKAAMEIITLIEQNINRKLPSLFF